jgi:beta-glucosidase/6-phospho-beta-glucosidase/beta-galactosidase
MSAQHYVNALFPHKELWPFATMTALGAEIEQEWAAVDALDTGALAQAENIRICHSFEPDEPGGVSIAYRKVTPHNNCRMVEVAVAYCSPHDTFSKKVGARHALDNFLDGATVLVPARTDGDHSIIWNLRNMFTI